ncbi:SRPBCC family protein [Methylorubrum suomiense]
MMRTVLLAAAALAAMATAADAQHAPTRRKVVESVTIAAPADKVWTVIGNPADATWIAHVTGAERVADAAKPTYRLTLDNGHALVEETRKLDAQARSFAYYLTQNDVADLPANDYSATLSVVPEGEGRRASSGRPPSIAATRTTIPHPPSTTRIRRRRCGTGFTPAWRISRRGLRRAVPEGLPDTPAQNSL